MARTRSCAALGHVVALTSVHRVSDERKSRVYRIKSTGGTIGYCSLVIRFPEDARRHFDKSANTSIRTKLAARFTVGRCRPADRTRAYTRGFSDAFTGGGVFLFFFFN